MHPSGHFVKRGERRGNPRLVNGLESAAGGDRGVCGARPAEEWVKLHGRAALRRPAETAPGSDCPAVRRAMISGRGVGPCVSWGGGVCPPQRIATTGGAERAPLQRLDALFRGGHLAARRTF